MNTPETINIEKYAEALNNLIGVDSAYYNGDKDVDAILELIVAAKKLEDRVKELVDEKERCLDALAELSDNIGLLKEKAVTDTVHKMQERFEERLDITVCGYSTEEVVSDILETLEIVAKEILGEE